MTTPTPSREAAQRAAKKLIEEFKITDWSSALREWVDCNPETVTAIIAAEFAPIVEKAEAADVLYKALADACKSEKYCCVCGHMYDRHGLDCELETYEAAQKAITP